MRVVLTPLKPVVNVQSTQTSEESTCLFNLFTVTHLSFLPYFFLSSLTSVTWIKSWNLS